MPLGVIGERFPDDLAIRREAADARSYEAWAWSEVPAGAQAAAARVAADLVEAIGERFPDDLGIQKAAAQARRREVYAWRQVPRSRL